MNFLRLKFLAVLLSFVCCTVSAEVYPDIDETIIKQAFSGKTLFEIKTFLENQAQISKSEVKFWPFWIERAPENREKIKIELELKSPQA